MNKIKLSSVVAVLAVMSSSIVLASPLEDAVAADYPYLEELFNHFHANPELSMQEAKTSDRLAEEMSALGYVVTRNIGKTGLVGIMENGDGPTLMIRADMDGLPVLEKTGLEYA
ncbi:MAG: amidohydrolase, partial [Proteobacteria bacterium]|nr:amidohydrolase [Pseudomonadota bacterium]